MTSMAFLLGGLPTRPRERAGSASQNESRIAVIGGMLAATFSARCSLRCSSGGGPTSSAGRSKRKPVAAWRGAIDMGRSRKTIPASFFGIVWA